MTGHKLSHHPITLGRHRITAHLYAGHSGSIRLRPQRDGQPRIQSATFATVTITATNTAPTLTAFTVTPATVAINTPVTATATFADPDAGQSHTVTFDWGDGSTPTAVDEAAGVMQASATHAYVAASTYTVTCTVADNGNPPLTATPQTAVITAYMPQLTDLQIGATPNPARVGQPLTVRATVDNPSGVSGTLAYSWSLVTPSGSAAPTPSGGQTTGTGPFTLTFTLRLTSQDSIMHKYRSSGARCPP